MHRRTPGLTMRGLMGLVAVIGGGFALARTEPALAAWLLLLAAPAASWTALRLERPGDAPSAGWDERLAVFLEALFWCASAVVALLVALVLVSPWVDALS